MPAVRAALRTVRGALWVYDEGRGAKGDAARREGLRFAEDYFAVYGEGVEEEVALLAGKVFLRSSHPVAAAYFLQGVREFNTNLLS